MLSQSNEDGIQGARFEAGVAADVAYDDPSRVRVRSIRAPRATSTPMSMKRTIMNASATLVRLTPRWLEK